MRPGPEKLVAIAEALGVAADVLIQESCGLSDEDGSSADERAGKQSTSIKDRLEAVEFERERRTALVTELGDRFNTAYDRARDEFFTKFLDVAVQIADAPKPQGPDGLDGDEQDDLIAQAQYLASFSSSFVANTPGGVGGAAAARGAAAKAPLTDVAVFGAAISGPLRVAATSSARALLGRRSLAAGGTGGGGGYLLLAAIVVPPAVGAAVVAYRQLARRSKQKEAELAEKLGKAEAGLSATHTGFDALVDVLPRATRVLDYIGVHASHAQSRWTSQLPEPPLEWSKISEDQKQRYKDFRTIAGCQLNVARIDFGAFMSAGAEDLGALIAGTAEVLNHARTTVEALV
jgi:transcriptional regulator with XRE-family HTH domain